VSVTAVEPVEDGGMPGGPVPARESFLDPLVARLSALYGLEPREVRTLAAQVLASFAGARVRAFVPVLVEKRLRDTCRRPTGPGTTASGLRGIHGGRGTTAAARRRRP
jgi:molybdopterin biosynthesis enzyme